MTLRDALATALGEVYDDCFTHRFNDEDTEAVLAEEPFAAWLRKQDEALVFLWKVAGMPVVGLEQAHLDALAAARERLG